MLGGRGWVGGWDNCKRLKAPPKNLLQEFECDAGVHPAPPPPARPSFASWNLPGGSAGGRAGGQVISSLHYHAWLTSLPFTCLCGVTGQEIFLKSRSRFFKLFQVSSAGLFAINYYVSR